MKRNLLSLLLLTIFFPAAAKIQLPESLPDGVTLRTDTVVTLWGRSNPFTFLSVTCSWDCKTYCAKADIEGRWAIDIQTPADNGAYTLDFSEMVGGDQRKLPVRFAADGFAGSVPAEERPQEGYVPLRKPQKDRLRLPAILSDNMVLQRETTVNIWGWSTPGKKVSVTPSWERKTYATNADDNGKWLVRIETPAAGGPYEVSVSSAGQTISLKNVLIGEVWICTGQSNMEMPVAGFWSQPVDGASETVVGSPNDRNVRFATIWRQTSRFPEEDCATEWCVPSLKSTPAFSAFAYFFARRLSEALDMPVGVIASSWGAARIEAFMTRDAIARVDDSYFDLLDNSKLIQSRAEYLYNGMIAPITRFTARGFHWYQGAANTFNCRIYADLMASMAKLWREAWGNPSMLFCIEQLTPFAGGKATDISRSIVVEQQYKALSMIPNSFIVPTSDYYNEHMAHLPSKQSLGERAAFITLVKAYGLESELPADPPIYTDAEFCEGKAVVSFRNAWYGLLPVHDEIIGFEIAGTDRKFYPARARILPKRPAVEVSSPQVPEPVAVRYAFRNKLRSNLTNTTGLPAYPFRTDDWDK